MARSKKGKSVDPPAPMKGKMQPMKPKMPKGSKKGGDCK